MMNKVRSSGQDNTSREGVGVRERYGFAGVVAGTAYGAGLSGFGWMNPYVALALMGAGAVYMLTLWTSARNHDHPSSARTSADTPTTDCPSSQSKDVT